jgi:YVTN family beta-propeller protein
MTMNMPLFRSDNILIKALLMTAFFALLLSGCTPLPSTVKPVLGDEGEVYLYLQPFPQEAARLRFTIERISLVASDGREFPLSLAMTDLRPADLKRQRFLAAVRVPPGRYQGLSCKIAKATLLGEEGEGALLVPEEPVPVSLPFEVQRRKAALLTLTYSAAQSVQAGFNFTPRFYLDIPSLPVVGLMGYAVNRDDNTVTVFDKKTGEAAAVIATGRQPECAVFDKTGVRAYVSLAGNDVIEVIDVAEGKTIDRINLNIGDSPHDLALTPDGNVLLAVNVNSRSFSFIDPSGRRELSRVPVGEGPRSLLMGRSGQRCYVFNRLSNTISVIDIANRALVTVISTDSGPLMGQFNRKGDRLYVIHEGSPYLSVFDSNSLALIKRVHVGTGLGFIKLDTRTDLLYAYRKGDTRLEIYDPISLIPGDSLAAMSGIVYMTIDSELNNLLLVGADKRRLLSVSLISRKTATETDLGQDPSWVTVMGER